MQNGVLSDIDLLYFIPSPFENVSLSKRAKMQNGGLSDIDLLYFFITITFLDTQFYNRWNDLLFIKS